MPNGRKRIFATFASSALLAASAFAATPAFAQTGSGSGEDESTTTCNIREDYYSCCPTWNPCTQFYIDAPLPPAEPVKPAESPED